jgi:ketose-bisphosphate aldolase
MALATFKDLLTAARRGHYAVGSFNTWNLFSTKNLVQTAERLRSPVILALYQTELDFAGEKQLYEACLSFGRDADVPVAVFIDHAKTLEMIDRAIAIGVSSVMIDGSHLPLAENIRLTGQAAKRAHEAGISCEGELGILGEEDGSQPDEALYTDIESVKPFVEGTDIDALAVAIGNAHGFYR